MKRRKKRAHLINRCAPRDCGCGGVSVLREEVILCTRQRIYYVQCSACDDVLRLGMGTVEFTSPEDAIKAWDAAMRGEPVHG